MALDIFIDNGLGNSQSFVKHQAITWLMLTYWKQDPNKHILMKIYV